MAAAFVRSCSQLIAAAHGLQPLEVCAEDALLAQPEEDRAAQVVVGGDVLVVTQEHLVIDFPRRILADPRAERRLHKSAVGRTEV